MVFEVLRKLFVSANGLGFGLQKGCKTVYTSSILVVASTFDIFDINDLALFFETPGRALSRVRNPLGTHNAAQKGTHRASIRRGPVDRCPGHGTALYGLPDIGVAVWFRSLDCWYDTVAAGQIAKEPLSKRRFMKLGFSTHACSS
jgi:hypothetical protein